MSLEELPEKCVRPIPETIIQKIEQPQPLERPAGVGIDDETRVLIASVKQNAIRCFFANAWKTQQVMSQGCRVGRVKIRLDF